MALDGIFLSRIRSEIEAAALGARIDKIAQPSREEVVLHLHRRGGGSRLLLSASTQSPRVHFIGEAPENPKSPPMFCMLLRKHLSGAKLAAVRQIGLDRILHLEFEASNELGDLTRITLALEIMGRHSNLIVVGEDGRIIDAIKRVDYETSSVRQVLPGMRYALPPQQNKLSLREASPTQCADRLRAGRDVELAKALQETLEGVSQLLAREIAHYALRGGECIVSEVSPEQWERLEFYLSGLARMLREGECTPTMVLEPSGRPRDFSCVSIRQYGAMMLTREYPDCSALLEAFYTERDRVERTRQRARDLLRLLANATDRIARKLDLQRGELLECARREELKVKGDLVSANLHLLQKGQGRVILENFYLEGSPPVEVELDPMLTPPQNAQRFYALYRKADTAEKMLRKLIVQGEEELAYLETVFDALTRASGEAELAALRQELAEGGYIRRGIGPRKQKREEKLPPLRYRSTDGFTILVGRNNVQNDKLTLRESRGDDLWLHTQKIPGSHTIVVAEGREIPQSTIEQACVVAAWNSRGRDSAKVPVDFTRVRNVKKPSGAKPGKVIYDRFETVIVDPDEALVKRLQQK